MSFTPVAVFTYNRPAHTRRMLDSLAACYRLEECKLFLFSDGPKIDEHTRAVQETRGIIRHWIKNNHGEMIERTENLGLARSIIDGVTRLSGEYGRVIVIEDDLILHPAFIHFMVSALDRYESCEGVAQISGFMFPTQHALAPDAFFLPYITSWGWATWARAWKLFNENPDLSALNDPELIFRFNHNGVTNHAKMLQDRLMGKNQSWAILFYWAVFLQNSSSCILVYRWFKILDSMEQAFITIRSYPFRKRCCCAMKPGFSREPLKVFNGIKTQIFSGRVRGLSIRLPTIELHPTGSCVPVTFDSSYKILSSQPGEITI